MELKSKFHHLHPDRFFLENDLKLVEAYLKEGHWISSGESLIALEKPGEGNMNLVLRARTNKQSFIIKQARPWVEKYPQIEAPIGRVAVEAQYFSLLDQFGDLKAYSPTLLGFDVANGILAIEDLGEGADYSSIYQKGNNIALDELEVMIQYLSILHHLPIAPIDFPDNMAMRKLNHEHIFNFPFLKENGFNLDDIQVGLQEASMPYKRDDALKSSIIQLGEIYLAQGTTLLHGDYYPGSWLRVETGPKVIDPEFGFIGPPEFDLGVLTAHLLMAEQAMDRLDLLRKNYKGFENHFREDLWAAFTGVEILRRLIGIAQLPLALSLEEKQDLMRLARSFILDGKVNF